MPELLSIMNSVPSGLLSLEASQLHTVLNGPTLIHLEGRRDPPLFIAVLQHGNEDTGWCAVRSLLLDYVSRPLPRSVSLFIGNVEAARYGLRFLDNQPDYNRIWNPGESADTPERKMVRQVTDTMRERGVFVSVDVHNNTGINPHYACVNRLDHGFLHLATLFSRTVVYFIQPNTVQSMAFAGFCTAVTIECGQPGQHNGVQHALEYLDACLNLSAIPDHPVAPHDIDLFHTVAVAKVPDDISFGFKGDDKDIHFSDDLDHLNFRELPPHTVLAKVNTRKPVKLDVRDEQGKSVADRFFVVENGELRTRVPLMPSMLSIAEKAIRQDCLCYLMERLPHLPNKHSG